jgi:hypothetical protein
MIASPGAMGSLMFSLTLRGTLIAIGILLATVTFLSLLAVLVAFLLSLF